MDRTKIETSIDKAYARSIEIRRQLHMNPELSCQEKETQALIIRELEALNIPYETGIFGYGVKGVIEGRDTSRSIAIRADMDALPIEEDNDLPYKSQVPGVMHACGHDVHVAALLGLASVLKSMAENLPCSITLIFQPSEETIGGAKQMIEAGCMNNPKVIASLGLHIDASTDYDKMIVIPGVVNAATREFHVKVIGQGCHGAHPDTGIDPLIPACNMVIAIQSIITRRLNPAGGNLITIGKFNSGSQENVIPDFTTFSGTIRTLDMKDRDTIETEISRICQGIAAAHGAKAEIEFSEEGYPNLINDQEMLEVVTDNYRELFGDDKVIIYPVSSLGADDFAYFCHESRGLYFSVGAKAPEDQPMTIHSAHMIIDERCLRTAISAEVYSCLRLMEIL